MVGLTNNDPATTPPIFNSSYTVCAQYDGAVTPHQNATLHCSPSSHTFRFVIVQLAMENLDGLCIPELSIYARGKQHVTYYVT